MAAPTRWTARARGTALALCCATAALTLTPPDGARAVDGSGGTAAPVARAASVVVNVTGVGGALAPQAPGTGGSEYGVASAGSKRAPAKRAHRAARPRSRSHKPPAKRKPASKPKQAKPAPAPAPVLTVPAPTPVGAPSPAQTLSEGAVFPVAGPHTLAGPEGSFGAPRSGHVHEGQDILAAEGLPNVAPLPGTIVTTGYQAGGAGWYVAEHTAGAFDLFFAHCQAGSVQVAAGQIVGAGTVLCLVGATGDATGPHLHFEMWLGGWRAPGGQPIDPRPYLEAWDARG